MRALTTDYDWAADLGFVDRGPSTLSNPRGIQLWHPRGTTTHIDCAPGLGVECADCGRRLSPCTSVPLDIERVCEGTWSCCETDA